MIWQKMKLHFAYLLIETLELFSVGLQGKL